VIPTEDLKHQHDIILVVLDAAKRQAALDVPDLSAAREMGRFLRGLCRPLPSYQGGKVSLSEDGSTREGGPIGVMLGEHNEGKGLVAEIKETVWSERRYQ
jgi:hypothetical protein